MVNNQAYLFLIFTLNGIIIGLLFDFFRILRRTFNTKDFITYIEDLLFWILTGFTLLYSIFTFNNGEIRLFMFIAVLLGIIIYMVFVSSYIIKINVKILSFLKNLVIKTFNIIKIPFNFVYKLFKKIFFKPIKFFIINIRRVSTNLPKKANNISKKIIKTKKVQKT